MSFCPRVSFCSKILNCAVAAGVLLAATFGLPASGEATTINFDGLSNGQLVGNAYTSQGVTFQRAKVFGDPFDNNGYTAPNAIVSIAPHVPPAVPGGVFGKPDAILVTFDSNVAVATIVALSVGFNGARIEAFDQVTGGTLLASDEAFGAPKNGLNQFFVLSVAAPGIRRLELFQPSLSVGGGDGLLFDTLTFDFVVPTETVTWGAIRALYR